MEWTEDTIQLLISLYRQNECLWNPKHSLYYNKLRKYDAWVQIAAELSSTVEECKKKVTNLLSSYRRERAKVKKKWSDEVYESNWFAYKSMEFLFDKNCPRKTLSTAQNNSHRPRAASVLDRVRQPQDAFVVGKPNPYYHPNKHTTSQGRSFYVQMMSLHPGL
ncbi:hypothetical protein RN001_003592 [Aquatica leii]|uniref:MADF domain-containing protein n=1 Tax=Aquatica leii TaxID=1421715 RepID=A0AAN7PNX7_9COLE|nr:hypothetical protein RN001_003592 [Aquatica leii]